MQLFQRLVREVARNGVSRFSTAAGESAGNGTAFKTNVTVPTWGLVGVGITVAGFFGKTLHDDNVETRRALQEINLVTRSESQAVRSELQAVNLATRTESQALMSALQAVNLAARTESQAIRNELQEVRREAREDNIAARKELREDMKSLENRLETKMDAGFKAVTDSIAAARLSPSR